MDQNDPAGKTGVRRPGPRAPAPRRRAEGIVLAALLLLLSSCATAPATRTWVVVHPSGYDGAEMIYDFVNENVSDADNVYWLRSSTDDEWPFAFHYDHKWLAPGGVSSKSISGDAYFVGGYYRACFKNAMSVRDPAAEAVIVSPGVYYGTVRTLDEQMRENDLTDAQALELIGLQHDAGVRIWHPPLGS